MKKQLIAAIAAKLHTFGYTVYIAESGEYGFYTDGVRVVSFGGSWSFSVDFSGNYSTDQPRSTGTGWGLDGGKDRGDIDEETARKFITENAPRWAVSDATVRYTTPEQHLKKYGSSSRYTKYLPE